MRRDLLIELPAALLTSLFLLCFTPATPAAADAPAPRLSVLADSLVADEDLSWNVPLELRNPTSLGIYADSLQCVVESLDPGETRQPRTVRLTLPGAAHLLGAVSGGDFGLFQYQVHAIAEHARLTFRLFTHQSTGPLAPLDASVEALPGPVSARYPSRFLPSGGGRLEYVFVGTADSVAAPGLLLIHGHGSNARQMLSRAIQLSRRGYAVMAASMPGYGLSSGPADFGGPATQKAMAAALDALEHSPGVDPTRIGVWGVSRGAGVAAALAERHREIRCAIAQSGIYDLWAVYRGTSQTGLRDTILAEAGRDSAAWRARSPVLAAASGSAPILILHGEMDRRVPAAQAHGFFEAVKAGGATAEADFIANANHWLPPWEVDRVALEYLARQLKP